MKKKYESFLEKKRRLLNEYSSDQSIFDEEINDGPYEEEYIQEIPYVLKETDNIIDDKNHFK